MSRAALVLGVVAALAWRPSLAQSPAENYKTYSLDMSVPESPAFTVLGVSPQNVVHPSSTRELATSLVNGIGKNGEVQTGLAIDTAPYLLVAGSELTLADYRNSYMTRLLANTQLSFGTAKAAGGSDASATRYGIGVQMKLYDRGDARTNNDYFDLPNCYKEKTDAMFNAPPINPLDPNRATIVAGRQKELEEGVVDCRKKAKQKLWNRSSWLLGLASAWATEGSDGTHSSGTGVWTTYAYGFEKVPVLEENAQLLFHARVHNDETVTDKTTATGFAKRDSWMLGTRFRYGSDTGSLSAEFSYTKGKLDYGQTESVRRLAVGGEIKITKDVWLVASVGGEGGFRDGSSRPFALGGLKFGSSSESQFPAR